MNNSDNCRILIIGFGISGKSAFNFLHKKGFSVQVFDDNNDPDIPNRIEEANINWSNIDVIIKSPSIHIMPHNRHRIIEAALAHDKPVLSTFDLFRSFNPNAKIIGVTGTDGKSTTVSLIYHIMKQAGLSVSLGGNIGIPYYDLPNTEYYIFEMSSYELISSKYLHFEIGAVLNIEPDHLEFHGTFENYIEAKHKILDSAKLRIISCEDHNTFDKYKFRENVVSVAINDNAEANYCIQENLLHSKDNQDTFDLSNLNNLLGRHNFQNIAFAFTICRALGIGASEIAHHVRTFRPLPHRLNVVRKIKDTLIINDSKATNPNSASKALATFFGYQIYWLIGGRSKHVDPLPYVEKYLKSVVKIYAFGEAADEFMATFRNLKPIEKFTSMDKALKKSYEDAQKRVGPNVILLSPMCASFDQFTSFEHRGAEFIRSATALP